MLLRQSVHPKVVRERLGHASIGITLDTYSDVMPGMQQEEAGKIDRRGSGGRLWRRDGASRAQGAHAPCGLPNG
jgi:hypothetical protein